MHLALISGTPIGRHQAVEGSTFLQWLDFGLGVPAGNSTLSFPICLVCFLLDAVLLLLLAKKLGVCGRYANVLQHSDIILA